MAFATRPDDPSSISRIHIVGRKNGFFQIVL